MVERIIAFLILLAILAYGSPARSEPDASGVPETFETQTLVGGGGPLGLAFLPTDGYKPSSKPFVLVLSQRFRFPKYSDFGLEVSAVLPCGAGANLVFGVIRTDNFRLNLVAPGVFWNTNNRPMARSQVSVDRLLRRWDVPFGLGADWRVNKIWISADYRVFMPDPIMLANDYNALARPYVDEAFKGGNLWLRVGSTW